jgi:hypothetical protein
MAHHFPAIAMVHLHELAPPYRFAPIVNGNQQHGGA